MKKTLVALLALSSVAMANEPLISSGSVDLTTTTKVGVPGWTVGGNGVDVYNYLYGTFNQGGKLVLTMNLNYAGGNCGVYQSVLHVGQDNTGFSVYVNGGTSLIVTEKHDTNARHEVQASSNQLVQGDNAVVITLQGLLGDSGAPNGTASVSVSVNGAAPTSVDNLSWQTMSWNADSMDQRTKYSFGCKAPGWEQQALQLITINNGTMHMDYTAPAVPEPATGALSLLALAGLCIRRRK